MDDPKNPEFSRRPAPAKVEELCQYLMGNVAPAACGSVLKEGRAYIGDWAEVMQLGEDRVYICHDGWDESGVLANTFGLSFVGPTYRLSCSVYHEPTFMESRGGLPQVYDLKCELLFERAYRDIMDLYKDSPNSCLGFERLLYGSGIKLEKLLDGYVEPVNCEISIEFLGDEEQGTGSRNDEDWFT